MSKSAHILEQHEPARAWDEGLPLGNGLLGALVWGDGRPLRFSLGRTDLWDLRPIPEYRSEEYTYRNYRAWVEGNRLDDVRRVLEAPYGRGANRLPGARIELAFGEATAFKLSTLSVDEATVKVGFSGGGTALAFVHASRPVGLIRVSGGASTVNPKVLPWVAPAEYKDFDCMCPPLGQLGFPGPVADSGQDWAGHVQECSGGFRFAVCLMWRREGQDWIGAWTIATNEEAPDALGLARSRVATALADGFDAALAAHREWWRDYWSRSAISLPNKAIERGWYLEEYKFASASRRGAPPIDLQGPWPADEGRLLPWGGGFYNDMNTQFSYLHCLAANHLAEGLSYLDWLWQIKPNCERWAREFWGMPGLNIPAACDITGWPTGGWAAYVHGCTNAAWNAQQFWLHWRFSQDRAFLRERAYPYLASVSTFLAAITEKGADGLRRLPLSSSPEFNNNSREAWHATMTNYDNALIRWAWGATAAAADELGEGHIARQWRALVDEMPPLAVAADDGRLLIAADYPISESHRHLSHLLAFHPLDMIRWEDGPAAQRIIGGAIREIERIGADAWSGTTWPWTAIMAARTGDGQAAVRRLEVFWSAFCLRNTFHVNGDQSGKYGKKFGPRFREFTLESNFLAASAVQEMLLQSHSGAIKVFPAVPDDWKDARFDTLRADGAFLVSAERRDGRTRSVTIVAEQGGLARLVDPFGEIPVAIEAEGVTDRRRADGHYTFACERGAKIALRATAAS